MDNERLHAEVLAQLEDLRAAQARIVAVGDTERRRLERDLHDGAQQHLVALSLALRLARPESGSAPALRLAHLIGQAVSELRLAIDELRELAHGIYPAVLADAGMAAALEAVSDDVPIPVTMADFPQERLPAPVEAAGYFLIAEACEIIAAVAKAEGITVEAKRDETQLVIQITSDGVARADPDIAAELDHVADRVGALGGSFRVGGKPGGAITIRAEMPCAL